jgi:hypothetical protein
MIVLPVVDASKAKSEEVAQFEQSPSRCQWIGKKTAQAVHASVAVLNPRRIELRSWLFHHDDQTVGEQGVENA